MSFLGARVLISKKWCEAAICSLVFVFSTGCATSDLLDKPDDKISLAQKKLKEALQARSLNQQDKMVALLKEAIELDPAEPNFHFFLGQAYFSKRNFERAEQEYLTSIKLNNDFVEFHRFLIDKEPYRQLGFIYMQQRSWQKAIQYFREDLARPGTWQPQQVYNWIALCFYNLGNKNEAEIEWKKALEIKENEGIRLNLALAYINQERFDQAIDSLRKALSLRPRFSQAHFELAQLYLREEKKEQAHLSKFQS